MAQSAPLVSTSITRVAGTRQGDFPDLPNNWRYTTFLLGAAVALSAVAGVPYETVTYRIGRTGRRNLFPNTNIYAGTLVKACRGHFGQRHLAGKGWDQANLRPWTVTVAEVEAHHQRLIAARPQKTRRSRSANP